MCLSVSFVHEIFGDRNDEAVDSNESKKDKGCVIRSDNEGRSHTPKGQKWGEERNYRKPRDLQNKVGLHLKLI